MSDLVLIYYQAGFMISEAKEEAFSDYSQVRVLNQKGKRKKQIIQTSTQTNQAYTASIKGRRTETNELNINIKTLTSYFLRTAQQENELTQEQISIVKQYDKMAANFTSLNFLFFGPQESSSLSQKDANQTDQSMQQARRQLRVLCLRFYQSSDIVRRIIRSSRMHIRNKLIMLKYLRRIEQRAMVSSEERNGWKDSDFFGYR